MPTTWILLASSLLGQVNPYYPAGYTLGSGNNYGYGYGYFGGTPLPLYDPLRYNRFYSGQGVYGFEPPTIANPHVISVRRPDTSTATTASTATASSSSGTLTGQVLALDEPKKQIIVQLPAGKVIVPYGPETHFLAVDGDLPVIKPGNLISVRLNTITILRRSPQ
jgi:hypothetical protein